MGAAKALARRAVAAPGWRWLPGMETMSIAPPVDGPYHLWRPSLRIIDDARAVLHDSLNTHPHQMPDDALPELTDPATLGCLLALVREAWGESEASTTAGAGYDGFWGWWAFTGGKQFEGATEAAALVAALEAAPVRR